MLRFVLAMTAAGLLLQAALAPPQSTAWAVGIAVGGAILIALSNAALFPTRPRR